MNLYYTYFNNTTQAELESAYQALCEGKNPKKIYVYFKDGDTIPEKLQEFRDSFPTKYDHFYCSFSNIDTLKADFLLQFMEYQSKNLCGSKMLEVNNGKVTLDGKEYVDLKNVPFAGNNEEYNLLLKSIKKTKKLLAITDEDDEEYRRREKKRRSNLVGYDDDDEDEEEDDDEEDDEDDDDEEEDEPPRRKSSVKSSTKKPSLAAPKKKSGSSAKKLFKR